METDLLQWATFLLTPITGVASWYLGRWKRKSDDFNSLQATITTLMKENEKLYEQIVKLRKENASLQTSVSVLTAKIDEIEQRAARNLWKGNKTNEELL